MTNDSDPRNKVLDLLADGKITASEAKSLLGLVSGVAGPDSPDRDRGRGELDRSERRGRRERVREGRSRDRDGGRRSNVYFRIRVDPRVDAGADPNADRLNIRVPIGLIKSGVRLMSLVPGAAADRVNQVLADRGIDLDFKNLDADRLEEILDDGGFTIDITEGDVRIRISVE
jgi:hypothetical protein